MRPLMDACVVSREKLAFIVDATAAPIASLVPISSWIGYEISLIQGEWYDDILPTILILCCQVHSLIHRLLTSRSLHTSLPTL